MSLRHYLTLKKDGEHFLSTQVIGNNEMFDEEFYNFFGIEPTEDGNFDEVEIFKDEPPIAKVQKFFLQYQRYITRRLQEDDGVGIAQLLDATTKYYSGDLTDTELLYVLSTVTWGLDFSHRHQYVEFTRKIYGDVGKETMILTLKAS